ncbi:MAG: 3'-5' exonuclease [Melioribacteraceae bacterium]|nr:3'-5' exonuclease [Melioribacteraceae bacterium]
MGLILDKPAITFDIESTGLDVVKDRILELGIIRMDPNNIFPELRLQKFCFRFNPGMHIPEEVTKIHGITDEDVAGEPRFKERAKEIKAIFTGCDIIGYNSNWFDVPMLVEKMLELDIELFDENTKFIDVQTIFKKKEERTLAAAVKFFLGKEHEDAHSALADAEATFEVLNAQIERYPDIGSSVSQLAKYSLHQDKPIVDYAGKLVYNAEGKVCYNIGNVKGTPVEDDTSFALWMLGKDFALDTKQKLRKILEELGEYGGRDFYEERDSHEEDDEEDEKF